MTQCLYIDRHGTRIGHVHGRLTLQAPEGEEQSLPSAQIEQIIILGQTHFTHTAISGLLKSGIPVIFSSHHGGYRGSLTSSGGYQIQRRIAQYDAMRQSTDCVLLARELIKAKLRGHARLLQRWKLQPAKEILTALMACRHCDELNTLRGYEGLGARGFFAGLKTHLADTPFPFQERRRRPPPDPANALLSLGYTLLGNEIEVGLQACGLDPAGGFLHPPENGRPTLIMDLVEPMRPLVDRFCARLLRNELTPEDFEQQAERCQLRDGQRGKVYRAWETLLDSQTRWRGESTTWRRLIHLQPRELARWLDGQISQPRFWYLDAP